MTEERTATHGDYPFKVILAGHNVDLDLLERMGVDVDALTPETFTAAYARISRFPQAVDELREKATTEIEGAQASSEKLVHGLGHTNPAEHAVFNIDFIDVSRLVTEDVEDFLYPAYTEKSQRYIKMDGGFVIPADIRDTPLEDEFAEHCSRLFGFYQDNFERVRDKLVAQGLERKVAAGKAKEDLRYVLPLATTAQFGSTFSARTLEVFLNRFLVSDNDELRGIAEGLFSMLTEKSPGLFKERYIRAHPFYRDTRREVREYVSHLIDKYGFRIAEAMPLQTRPVELHTDLTIDHRIGAALIFSSSLLSYTDASILWEDMKDKERIELDRLANQHRGPWQAPLPEYGTQSEVVEMIISATAFAQLKRHRQARIIRQDYNPELGITMPQTLLEAGLADEVENLAELATGMHDELLGVSFASAPYALTNAHRRRIIMSPDVANAIWIANLRCDDAHAQWDVRQLAHNYVGQMRTIAPVSMRSAIGREKWDTDFADYRGSDK